MGGSSPGQLASYLATVARKHEAFLEDVEWMAEYGETPEGAAVRLGRRSDDAGMNALHKQLCRLGRPDLWARLRANDPLWAQDPLTGVWQRFESSKRWVPPARRSG